MNPMININHDDNYNQMRRIKWFHILTIILITFVVYSNSLNNTFVYDDKATIEENSLIRNVRNIPLFFNKNFFNSGESGVLKKVYRPLAMISFALNYRIGKFNVVGYHVVSVLFHTANAVLIYLLMRMFFGMETPSTEIPGRRNDAHKAAFFSSLLFAVHPVNTEAVNYIWQRSELMASFFYLLALVLFIKHLNGRRAYLCYLFSVISFMMALLSKEMAVTLPAILMLVDWYFISGYNKKKFINNIKQYHLLFLLIALLYSFFRLFSYDELKTLGSQGDTGAFWYFITQPRAIMDYFRLMILPVGLSIDHFFPFSESIIDIRSLLSLIVIGIIVMAGIRLSKTSKTISLFILWFFIILIPTSSIISLYPVIMNEHRIYLPCAGMISALIILLYKRLQGIHRDKLLPAAICIVLILFSLLTMRRNSDWSDGVILWSKVLQNNKNSVIALNSRGMLYKERGLHDKALSDFSAAIVLFPEDAKAHYNRGATYKKKGIYDKAITDYNKALKINPGNARVYNSRGVVYGIMEAHDKAVNDFSKAIELWPYYVMAYNNRSITHRKMGRYDLAENDKKEAEKILMKLY